MMADKQTPTQTPAVPTIKLPLQGRRIVVTRAREQAGDLAEQLRQLGAEPIELPAISIAPLQDFTLLDAAIARLPEYDWVIFTSVNGVQAVAARMQELGLDINSIASSKLAAIGPATRSGLEKLGCTVSFMPDTYVAEAIVEQIGDVRGRRVLLPRADIARKALADGLRHGGAHVDEVAAYRTVHNDAASELAHVITMGAVDAWTFTSSSTVRFTIDSLLRTGMDEQQATTLMNKSAIICIGPITAGTARDNGLAVAAVAWEYTIRGLVEALVQLLGPNEQMEGIDA